MKTGRARALISCLALLGLAACTPNPHKQDPSARDSDEGIVLFSVSQDPSVGANWARAFFLIDGGSERQGQTVSSVQLAFEGFVYPIYSPSDFPDDAGKLVALRLPAGKHRFDSWLVRGPYSTIAPKESPSPLEFEVQAGQAIYLGNLHMHLQAVWDVLGGQVVFDASAEVRDQRDRDLQAYRLKYPQQGAVAVALLAQGPWAAEAAVTPRADSSQATQRLGPGPFRVTPRPASSSSRVSRSGSHSGKGALVAVLVEIALSQLHLSRRSSAVAESSPAAPSNPEFTPVAKTPSSPPVSRECHALQSLVSRYRLWSLCAPYVRVDVREVE